MSDRVIYAIMLLRGADKYFFLFDATSFNKLTDQMIKYARDPELNFTWHDFGMLSQKAKLLINKEKVET